MQKNIRVRDEPGIFCLTEAADSDRMWTEYADQGRGFIIGFDTLHNGFDPLKGRGHLGKVTYSDEPIGSALGSLWNDDAVGALFRKRMEYAFDREWRSVRMLKRLERRAGDVFLSPFHPASVREIIIRPDCTMEANLLQLVEAPDGRYQHLQVNLQG